MSASGTMWNHLTSCASSFCRFTGTRLGTEPAGRPSFLGRPTGRLILGSLGESLGLLVLPFGRPRFRFPVTVSGSAVVVADEAS
jgi:hypothetical protein